MAMNKVYTRINWEDYPSENTDLDAYNLNQMDSAIDALDNRIISQDALKVDKSAINGNIADWTMDETTGIITITKYNGEKVIKIRKPFNRDFDAFYRFPFFKGFLNSLGKVKPDAIITEGFFQWTPMVILYSIIHRIPVYLSYERTAHTERFAPKFKIIMTAHLLYHGYVSYHLNKLRSKI